MQNQSVFKSRGDYSKMYCDAKLQYRETSLQFFPLNPVALELCEFCG